MTLTPADLFAWAETIARDDERTWVGQDDRRAVIAVADVKRAVQALRPAPLTVLAALADERVRRGEMWIETDQHDGIRWRVSDGEVQRSVYGSIDDDVWCDWYECPLDWDDLSQPCTLAPPTGEGG